MSSKIILTGATGWLGQEFLYRQVQEYGESVLKHYVLCASSAKEIKLFNKFPVKIHSLDDLNPNAEITGLIHLAFTLRHRVSEFGITNFLELNSQITKLVVQHVEEFRPNWIVNVSSGAIFDRETGQYETDALKNPYGYGKYQEELALIETATAKNATISIGRLWGASGYKMPPNPAYALSDFIISALNSGTIQIKSNFQVYRRYCDAAEFVQLLVNEAISGNNTIINSGGPLHELGDIAAEIAKNIPGTRIFRPEIVNPNLDDYYPRESTYEELAAKQNLSLSNLQQQIKKTINGHIEAIPFKYL